MDFSQWFQDFLRQTLDFIPHLIVALIVFVIALLIARPASRWVVKKVNTRIEDDAIIQLLSRVTTWFIIITGTLIALDQVNFDVTGFIAGLGIAGLTIGFALQDIARNFIAGVILLLRKTFEINDEVEVAGYRGHVLNINTRDTVLITQDGEVVILPNLNVFNNAIINYSDLNHRRRTIRIGLGYGEDVTHASQIFMQAIKGVNGVEEIPAVTVLAEELGNSTLTLVARFWVNQKTHSLLSVHSEVIRAIKEAAEKENIDLPYPIQVVKLEKTDAGKE